MIKNIKVVAADVDMTLANKGADLPLVTKQAFELLHKQGIKIGLCTGRVIEEAVMQYSAKWGLSFQFDFIIGMNGGMIYRLEDDSLDSCPMLTHEEMLHLVGGLMPLVMENKISLTAEGGGNHSAMFVGKTLQEVARRHGIIFDDVTGDVEAFCAIPAYKLLLRGTPDQDKIIRDYFHEHFDEDYAIVGTFPGTVEILHKGIDKGNGLMKYCQSIDMDMKNVIAFGDNENDNTMLEKAGWGVCLLNGSSETKTHADDVTKYPCVEGGVGHYLFDNVINKKDN